MQLRKSTRIWLVLFGTGLAAAIVLDRLLPESGCFGAFAALLAVAAGLVLLSRATAVAFRAIIRKTTRRLAFSYFLIGIVPIPLLLTLLFLGSYIVAHQYMANRLRREITAVGEAAVCAQQDLPEVRVGADGRVESSGVPWLAPGTAAPWIPDLARPGFARGRPRVWLAVPRGPRAAVLLNLSDPDAPWLQQLGRPHRLHVRASTPAGPRRGTAESTSRSRRRATPPFGWARAARRSRSRAGPPARSPRGKGSWTANGSAPITSRRS